MSEFIEKTTASEGGLREEVLKARERRLNSERRWAAEDCRERALKALREARSELHQIELILGVGGLEGVTDALVMALWAIRELES